MYLKQRVSVTIEISLHVILLYLSAELKTPDHLIRYDANIHISVCLMHDRVCVY